MTATPDELRADCPGCGEKLWRQRKGDWTLANRIIKLAKGCVVAKCPKCGDEVDVPFLQVASPIRAHRRLVVNVDRLDKAG
jgi:predicted RNA-binding Zn-ribbon protein involved in translation (DUF1610 family)